MYFCDRKYLLICFDCFLYIGEICGVRNLGVKIFNYVLIFGKNIYVFV